MMNQRIHTASRTMFTSCLLALHGCAVDLSHELGDEPSSRSDEVVQSAEATQQPVAQLMSEFDGRWVGEAEDPLSLSIEPEPYHFPSGSTRITLDLHWNDPSASRITFGEGPEVLPPTDPDTVYPANAADYYHASWFLEPFEAFAYPVYYNGLTLDDIYRLDPAIFGTSGEADLSQQFQTEGRVADGRLNLGYSAFDMVLPWCELQPPERGCSPEADFASWGFADDGSCIDALGTAVDCAVRDECNNVCRQTYTPIEASLLLQRSVDGLVGVFSGDVPFRNARGFLAPIGPVRFRRALDGE